MQAMDSLVYEARPSHWKSHNRSLVLNRGRIEAEPRRTNHERSDLCADVRGHDGACK